MEDMLSSSLHEYKCKGKLLSDSTEWDVDFILRQMENGRLIGKINAPWEALKTLDELLKSFKEFRLFGKDESGSEIVVNSCYLTGFTISTDVPTVSAEFVAFEAVLNPERLEDRPKSDLLAEFALLNVDETFRVKVDTQLGKLCLRPVREQRNILRVIKVLGVSRVTTVAQIFIEKPNPSLTFKELLSNLSEVINGFLCISRLADACYHEWCSVGIYEKMENSNYKLILYKMREPKIKPPKYRSLTNLVHSSIFYESAYAGYRGREKELDELYDFKRALEWYVEANIASVLESGYLMLCTCLELLVDRYQTKTNTEFIMDPDSFKKQMLPALRKTSRELMKKLGMTSDQRREIYGKLKGLNRRSFKSGLESLLCHLKVKYEDLFYDLDTIIKIRNKITHTGKYEDANELSNAFNKLYVLLARIFLSILNYKQDYFDWTKHEWVSFKEVSK